MIISGIILLRYKPAYEVTIAGEKIGFIASKEAFESEINEFINDTTGNVAFVEVVDEPEYEYKLIGREQKTTEEQILSSVKANADITYKTYAISVDGEKKAIVSSEDEANKVIATVKENTKEGVNLDFGINVEYS